MLSLEKRFLVVTYKNDKRNSKAESQGMTAAAGERPDKKRKCSSGRKQVSMRDREVWVG